MKTTPIRAFKKKIEEGAVYGPFSKIADPAVVETAGFSGFDFIIIDLEHGPNSVQSAQNLIRAAECSGILPIVRVKEGNESVIGEVLDIGAGGIQVPQVTSAAEAARVIELARFAPLGMRGVCRFVRAADYSVMDRFEYFKSANEAVIILQLEGKEAIENLEEILNVKGFDIIFIGPYDLSQSLGIPGDIDNPLVEAEMKKIIKKCSEKGVKVGTFVDTVHNAKKWKNAGVKYISYSVDVGLLHDQFKMVLQEIR